MSPSGARFTAGIQGTHRHQSTKTVASYLKTAAQEFSSITWYPVIDVEAGCVHNNRVTSSIRNIGLFTADLANLVSCGCKKTWVKKIMATVTLESPLVIF